MKELITLQAFYDEFFPERDNFFGDSNNRFNMCTPSLKALYIDFSAYDEYDFNKALKFINENPQIEAIYLYDWFCGGLYNKNLNIFFEALGKLEQLKFLAVPAFFGSEAVQMIMRELLIKNRIQALDISGSCAFQFIDFSFLEGLNSNTLKVLNLRDIPINNQDIIVKIIKTFTNLTYIDISSNHLTFETMKELCCALKNNNKLQTLLLFDKDNRYSDFKGETWIDRIGIGGWPGLELLSELLENNKTMINIGFPETKKFFKDYIHNENTVISKSPLLDKIHRLLAKNRFELSQNFSDIGFHFQFFENAKKNEIVIDVTRTTSLAKKQN